jgi:adenine phosphoribosyltransferase
MPEDITQKLRDTVQTVPDFPIEGIMFRDITPVLSDGSLLSATTDLFIERMNEAGWKPDAIIGPEARAAKLGISFVPIRKPGKLPASKMRVEYSLEYGTNSLEMHEDALKPGEKAVIVDDLLATGGTVNACAELCRQAGAEIVGALFLIELRPGLDGRRAISPIPSISLLEFPA